jgi:hypothetical protein
MGKVTKKSLTRGSELTVEHLESIGSTMTQLSTRNVALDNRVEKSAPFSLSWNIPWMDSKYFYDNDPEGSRPFYTSFCLPPVQDQFVTDETSHAMGEITINTKIPVLDSIGFSFDNRDSTGAVLSPWYGTSKATLDDSSNLADGTVHYQYTATHQQFEPNPYEGFLAFLRSMGSVKLAIYEKSQTYYDVRQTDASFLTTAVASDTSASYLRAKFTKSSHGLAVGDRFRVSGAESSPDNLNGEWEVVAVSGNDFFVIADISTDNIYNAVTIQPIERLGNAGVRGWKEIYSISLEDAFLQSPAQVPVLVTGMNIPFDPFKTYSVALFAPGLHDDGNVHDSVPRTSLQELAVDYAQTGSSDDGATGGLNGTGKLKYRLNEHLALVSTWLNLNFKMEMMDRDTGSYSDSASLVQNMPAHTGNTTQYGVSDVAPSAGSEILADASGGVSSRMSQVDRVFLEKMRGGYGPFSKAYPYEHIKEDAAYDVITVPLMQGFENNQLTPLGWQHLPYRAAASADIHTFVDRRIIPITSPLTIQHVVACLNFTGEKVPQMTALASSASVGTGVDANTTADPYETQGVQTKSTRVNYTRARQSQPRNFSPLFTYQIGVALVTGENSANFGYQQVAYAEYEFSRERIARYSSPLLIDAVDQDLGALAKSPTNTEWFTASDTFPPADGQYRKLMEQALVAVPLVQRDTQTGNGYWGSYTDGVYREYQKGTQGKPFFAGESSDSLYGLQTVLSVSGVTSDVVTTASAHHLKPDDLVRLEGLDPCASTNTDDNLEGKVLLVATVPSSTTFTLKDVAGTAIDFADNHSAAGTVNVLGSLWELDSVFTIAATDDSDNTVTMSAAHGLSHANDTGKLCLISGTGDATLDGKFFKVDLDGASATTLALDDPMSGAAINIPADNTGGKLHLYKSRYPRNFVGTDAPKATAGIEGTSLPGKSQGQEQYIEVRMAIVPKKSYAVLHGGRSGGAINLTGNQSAEFFPDDVIRVRGTGDAGLDGKYFIVTDVTYLTSGTYSGTTQVTLAQPYAHLSFAAPTIAAATYSAGTEFACNLGNYRDILVGYGGNFLYLISKKHLRA